VSPTLANFLFEAGNFLLLAAGLGWVLFKPVRKALNAERERHQKEHDEAEQLKAEATALANKARADRDAAQQELEDQRQQVIAAAKEEAAKLLEQARKTQQSERQALQQELDSTRRSQTAALADSVARVAADAVRQLLETISGPSLDAALVEATCTRLEKLPRNSLGSPIVESARPLEPPQLDRLRRLLGADFEHRVIPELGAGVRVTTSAGQVDATAASFARRAAELTTQLQPEGSPPSAPESSRDG
jgi:F0F1-type ATP synthase membrane subunit b/b'